MSQVDASGGRSPDVADKWGVAVAERGFAQLPNYLLYLNQFLDEDHRLSAIELLVVVQIAAAWWRKGSLPFPSMSTLATRCGVSERQVQRAVTRLEGEGLLRRVKRRASGIIASNAYDLEPLVVLLGRVAKAFPNAFPRRIEVGDSSRFFEAEEPAQLEPPVSPAPQATKNRKVTVKPPRRRIRITGQK